MVWPRLQQYLFQIPPFWVASCDMANPLAGGSCGDCRPRLLVGYGIINTWVQNSCWSRHYSLLNLLFTGTKLWITDWERLQSAHCGLSTTNIAGFTGHVILTRKTRACVTEAHGSIFFPQNGVVSQSEEPIIGILLYWSLKTNCQKRPIVTWNTHRHHSHHRHIVTHSYHTDPMRIVAISHVWMISQISQNQMQFFQNCVISRRNFAGQWPICWHWTGKATGIIVSLWSVQELLLRRSWRKGG